tara:strand:+ start:607 stop:873 length:267 start_codon:yes stop_codon:yes gene_type:complete
MEFHETGPFILKVEYIDANNKDSVIALRYDDYERGLEFLTLIEYTLSKSVGIYYMTEREYIQQAWERDELWLLEIVKDSSDDFNLEFN